MNDQFVATHVIMVIMNNQKPDKMQPFDFTLKYPTNLGTIF